MMVAGNARSFSVSLCCVNEGLLSAIVRFLFCDRAGGVCERGSGLSLPEALSC